MTAASIAKTVAAPPQFYNTSNLTNMYTLSIDPTKFQLLESVKIILKGDPASTTSQTKSYIDSNLSLLDNTNLRLISHVSSWAIVLDVTWKAAFADVRKQGTTPSLNVYPAVGTTGDTIAVLVNVDKAQY